MLSNFKLRKKVGGKDLQNVELQRCIQTLHIEKYMKIQWKELVKPLKVNPLITLSVRYSVIVRLFNLLYSIKL